MGSFSPWRFIILLIIVAFFGIPGWRILSRMGFSPAWLLVCLIPFGAVIGLWVLAFTRWPALPALSPSDQT